MDPASSLLAQTPSPLLRPSSLHPHQTLSQQPPSPLPVTAPFPDSVSRALPLPSCYHVCSWPPDIPTYFFRILTGLFLTAVEVHSQTEQSSTEVLLYGSSAVKNQSASAEDTGDTGLTLGAGRSPGEGNDNPFQYFCLGNPMDREPGGLWFVGSQRVRQD